MRETKRAECLNKTEYASIMLNMLVYACISLNKLSTENVRTLNMSDAVIGIRSLYKLMSSYRDRALYSVFRPLSNI